MKSAHDIRAALPIVLAIAGGVLLFDLMAFGFGQAPASALRMAFDGTWGTAYGIGQVLFKATPLLFTGLAFEVALRAGLFNIGAEGQLALASLVGAVVASKLPPSLPAVVALPIVLCVAAATGAAEALGSPGMGTPFSGKIAGGGRPGFWRNAGGAHCRAPLTLRVSLPPG